MTGDHRDDRGVAVAARPGSGAAGSPRRLRAARAVQAAELVQGHVQLDLGGLPGPVRQAPRTHQPPASLLQRIMITLTLRPHVLQANLLAQRLKHGPQSRGALRSKVARCPPGVLQRQIQPKPPVSKTVIAIGIRRSAPALHLLGQTSQVRKLRAASCRG
jgi:hypothetical protein